MAKPPSPAAGQTVHVRRLGDNSVHEVEAERVKFRPAGYGILIHDDRCLLSYSRFTHRWDFPGGGIEPWELMEQGMVREFLEETGLHVCAGNVVDFRDDFMMFFKNPFHSLRVFFRAFLQEGQDVNQLIPDLDEIVELKWWTRHDIPDLSLDARDREILETAFLH